MSHVDQKIALKVNNLSKIELNHIFMVNPREIINKNYWIAGDYIPPITECVCEENHFYHDCGNRKINMQTVLQSARTDPYYSLLFNTIKEEGFKSPLSAVVSNKCESIVLVDGHHRLAIAIDLKMKKIPIYVAAPNSHIEDLVAADSGSWREGKILYPPLLDRSEMIR